MPSPFNHIQLYWTEDTWYRSWLHALAARFRLVQFDSRGQGMSTRGLPQGVDYSVFDRDLQAVVDRLSLRDFVIMAHGAKGISAVRYAVKNPGRVRALVWVTPWVGTISSSRAFLSLAERDWDAFLTSTVGMSGERNVQAGLRRLRQTTTQADYVTASESAQRFDIHPDLSHLQTPTLLLQSRDFLPRVEQSKQAAALIHNARLVLVDGANLGDLSQGLTAIDNFLSGLPLSPETPSTLDSLVSGLSSRETQVLRLLAAGRSNPQIAEELVISINTARKHVSNILAKTGAANRTEAAVYARDRGLA
jgi:DNA-binding NarL/FixJ family response regulator